jgi:probable rRNA maturation factor
MIGINNLTSVRVDEHFLKKIAKSVLKKEGKGGLELSVVSVGPERMKTLNKKYRKKNKVTDVLSFPYDGSGEIVLCPKEIKKNAKKFKSGFKKELARALIHGILHLFGYEHEISKKAARRMQKKEESYLNLFFK